MLRYTSEKGYNYTQRTNGSIVRIPSSEINSTVQIRAPKIGDRVKIIIKPYYEKTYIIGIVDKVLTRKKFHTRGHKVRLKTGIVGRIIYIFEKK